MDQVFFSNSGAESNEAAIKMTRLYARKKDIDQPIIIAMDNAFHGRTLATLSLSGSKRLQIGFEPLLDRFIHIPFNNIAALEQVIKQHKKNIIAIMLEPIQGDGGIQVATPHFLKVIRNYCDQYDWLMILDEIQTGLCRTGSWFAYQAYNILPDIVTIAKTLGNGFPIGAYCSRGKANNIFPAGKHGSTFAGSPLACKVASALAINTTVEQVMLGSNDIGDDGAVALAEALTSGVKDEFNLLPQSVEGTEEGRWVVIDYGSLIIHIYYDFANAAIISAIGGSKCKGLVQKTKYGPSTN
jgi:acetylornithine aminotransferase